MPLELCFCGCTRSVDEVVDRLKTMFELNTEQAQMMYEQARLNAEKLVEAVSS